MNRLMLLSAFLFISNLSLKSQNELGVSISSGIGFGDFYNETDYQIGFPVSFPINRRMNFLTGLEISRKNNLNQTDKPTGFSFTSFNFFGDAKDLHNVKQFTCTYMQIPLLIKAKHSRKRYIYQFGVVPAFGLGGTVSRYKRERWSALLWDRVNDFTDSAVTKSLEFNADNIRRFDLQGRLAIGIRIWKFELGANFSRSLINLSSDKPYKPLHNTSLMVSLDYFLIQRHPSTFPEAVIDLN